MTNPAHQSDVQINRIHSGAICKEMGERLAARLGPQSNELPARLLALMEQLEKVEHRDSSAN
jgi:predicted kinase